MRSTAFLLILSSALLNAFWNVSAKKVSGSFAAIWIALCIAALAFIPWVLAVGTWASLTPAALQLIAISIGFNTLYFVLLAKSYEWGEMTVVYPISRGFGVLFTALAGVSLLGETVNVAGAAGIALICAGSLALSLGRVSSKESRIAILLALGIGASIAACSYIAKPVLVLVHPVVYNFALYFGSAVFLAPYVYRREREACRAMWRRHRRECLVIGLGSPFSYVLALYAFRLGPISYLGPLRESSIVMGAVLGYLSLGERIGGRKMLGILLLTLGVVLIKVA